MTGPRPPLLLAGLALAACGSEVPAPSLDVVIPRETYSDQATPVVLHGAGLYPGLTIDTATGRGAYDSTKFQGRVGHPGAYVPLSEILWVSTVELQAVVEPGLPPGTYDLELTDPHGRTVILTDGFTSLGADREPPTIAFESPLPGTAFVPGADIDVTVHAADVRPGRLDAVTLATDPPTGDPLEQKFTDHPSESPASFRITAPLMPSGSRLVLVAEARDLAAVANVTRATLELVLSDAPALDTVEPRVGPTTGGGDVLVHGANFVRGTKVYLGALPLEPDGGVVVDALTIAGRAPPHDAGVVDVTVKATTGEITLPGAYEYREIPTVTAISPDSGPTSGGTHVVVTGERLGPDTRILLGETLATAAPLVGATFIDAEHIEGTVPAGRGRADVWALDPVLGAGHLRSAYQYLGDVCVTAIEPAEGPEAGGISVTVRGCGFVEGTLAYLGMTLAPLAGQMRLDESTIVGTLPPGSGVVDVVVLAPSLLPATLLKAFTYRPAPTVTTVTPGFGPAAGGPTVRVEGSGFVPAVAVLFGTAPSPYVTFESSTSVLAVLPAHVPGTVDVTVAAAFGSATLVSAFQFRDATDAKLKIAPDRFFPGDDLTVEVVGDLDSVANPTPGPGNDTLTATLASDTDAETITLLETAVEGTFSATVATSAAAAIKGNGKLEIAVGAAATATYVDASRLAGGSVPLIAIAEARGGSDASLLMTPGTVSAPGVFTVTVTDGDPHADRHAGAGNDFVVVAVSTSGGDAESFLVPESATEGVFTRIVDVRPGAAGPATGVVEVSPGEKITAAYLDTLRADGSTTGVELNAGGMVAP